MIPSYAGVLGALADYIVSDQIGNSSANAFPMLLLAGSAESNLVTKGAFQEMDAISLLNPHTKLSIRPKSIDGVVNALHNAYRTSWYGRPGTGFIDLPADIIQGVMDEEVPDSGELQIVPDPPRSGADEAKIFKVVQLVKAAKAPLIVIGKGAAYARAESCIRRLVDSTHIPFLPTPMGKGVVPDSHSLNAASARSSALKNTDVVLLLGARLNWILHFGDAPKWSPSVKFIQVDISAEEIGRNSGTADLGLVGDIEMVINQLLSSLSDWQYNPSSQPSTTSFSSLLATAKSHNESSSSQKALQPTKPSNPLTFQRAFHIIKSTLHSLSPPDKGGIVYVSEGANTMDISRSVFPVHLPRLRLDAGTYATMGVGLGYAIAAYAAYNLPSGDGASGSKQQKKIVALEGDSAFGFSAMEVETMARQRMPILIFVMNNSGVYHGDVTDASAWQALQLQTAAGQKPGLRSTSLGYETRYEKLAEMCGGRGWFVRTERELEEATRQGFMEQEMVCVVNVVVEAGVGRKIQFGWQASLKGDGAKKKGKEAKL